MPPGKSTLNRLTYFPPGPKGSQTHSRFFEKGAEREQQPHNHYGERGRVLWTHLGKPWGWGPGRGRGCDASAAALTLAEAPGVIGCLCQQPVAESSDLLNLSHRLLAHDPIGAGGPP
jgi:hypothetical protein